MIDSSIIAADNCDGFTNRNISWALIELDWKTEFYFFEKCNKNILIEGDEVMIEWEDCKGRYLVSGRMKKVEIRELVTE